jgi:hypothetical protein
MCIDVYVVFLIYFNIHCALEHILKGKPGKIYMDERYGVKYPPKFNFVILCWTFFISLDFLYSPFKFAFRSLNFLHSTFKFVFYIHKFSFYSTVRILHSSLHFVHWTFCIRHSSLYSTFISSHFIRLFAFYIQVCILFMFFNCASNRNPRGMSVRGLKRWFAPFAPQNKRFARFQNGGSRVCGHRHKWCINYLKPLCRFR